MSEVKRINPEYNPKVEVLKSIKLPIELKNSKGETIASIQYWEGSEYVRSGYHGFVNGHHVYEYGHAELTDCIEATFAYLYTQMNDFRKVAEKHERLVGALKESLSTPWNKL